MKTTPAKPSADGDRVQKLIARTGLASRREAEVWIEEGRVTINGRTAKLGDRATAGDAIKVDGRQLGRAVPQRYFVMNKPRGVVTTVADPEKRKTVMDLVPPRWRKGLFPVGRLDHDSEGLLLLTTDGDWAQGVAHPRHSHRKTYEVKVKGTPAEAGLQRLRSGMTIDGKKLRPVVVKPFGRRRGMRSTTTTTWWLIELQEGRSRQIREMFFRIGHPVQRLRRITIGPLRLEKLPIGALRLLLESEIERLRDPAPGVRSRSVRAPRSAKKKRRVTLGKTVVGRPGPKATQ